MILKGIIKILNQILINRKKILGINRRNLDFVKSLNPPESILIANNKIKTKILLKKHNLPTPKTIKIFKKLTEVENFDLTRLPKSFVIKPAFGSKGGGIEIIFNRIHLNAWINHDGEQKTELELKNHIKDILEGKFSKKNRDIVLIEERIKPLKSFKYLTYKGTPDIRIILCNYMPVMGMLRVPTEASSGKANLDLGALGLGIDLSAGITTGGILGKSEKIEKVPYSRLSIKGIKIPEWEKILEYSIQASKALNLKFSGIDILLDEENGPLIIEVNAKPGLSIQLANSDGLNWRMEKTLNLKNSNTDKIIRLSKVLFGGEVEEEIQNISGKKILGLIEPIILYSDKGKSVEEVAKIDTGADNNSISKECAIQLGYGDILIFFEDLLKKFKISKETTFLDAKKIFFSEEFLSEIQSNKKIIAKKLVKSSNGFEIRVAIELKIKIKNQTYSGRFNITDRHSLKYKILLGKKLLKNFLIDPENSSIRKG